VWASGTTPLKGRSVLSSQIPSSFWIRYSGCHVSLITLDKTKDRDHTYWYVRPSKLVGRDHRLSPAFITPAGRRTIISGTEGHRFRLPRCTNSMPRNQPSCRPVGRVQFLNPNKAAVPNEYAHVMDENNWTSVKSPNTLIGCWLCRSIHSVHMHFKRSHAVRETQTLARTEAPLGNSDVNVDILIISRECDGSSLPQRASHGDRVQHARQHRSPSAIRSKGRPHLSWNSYSLSSGRRSTIAHLAGGGGYDDRNRCRPFRYL